jgi:zinc protease
VSGWLIPIALFSVLSAPPPKTAVMDLGHVREATLANGLHVIVKHEPYWGIVGFTVQIRCGSSRDPEGKAGLCHLMEHLLFESKSKQRPGLGRVIEDLGGYVNAETMRDFVSVETLVASPQFGEALKLVADRVTRATFEATAVTGEKQIVMQELADRNANADVLVDEALWQAAFEKHPYRFPIGGTKETLDAIKAEDCTAQYKQFFVPNNSALIVVGDVDPDAVFEAAKNAFGPWEKREVDYKAPAPEPPMHEVRARILHGQNRASVFTMGFRAPGIEKPAEVCAMDLIYSWLGQGENAWLQRVLVREKKLAVAADCDFLTQRWPGLLIVTAVCAPEQELEARSTVAGAIRQLRDTQLSDAELDRVKRMVYTQYAFSNETYLDQAGSAGFYEMIGSYKFAFEYTDLIMKVTPADVQAVARKYLDPDAYAAAVLRPQRGDGQDQEAGLSWH